MAGVFGLAAVAEGLMYWGVNTDNRNLRATGTALSGQITGAGTTLGDAQVNCDATQAVMAATSNAWKVSSDLWGQRALTAEAALIGTAGAPASTLESPTPTDTVTPTPKGQICYVPVPWTRTPTRTPSPEVKITLTPTGWVIGSVTPGGPGPTSTPGGGCVENCGGGGDQTPVSTNEDRGAQPGNDLGEHREPSTQIP